MLFTYKVKYILSGKTYHINISAESLHIALDCFEADFIHNQVNVLSVTRIYLAS